MTVTLNPYLGFRGEARAALAFYASVLGGAPVITTFAEGGMPHDPEHADDVMHGQLDVPGGLTLMASDAPADMDVPTESSVTISLSGGPDDADTLRGWYAGLSAGGSDVLPLERAPWGDDFGMFTDRFGTGWMVTISGLGPQEG
ncbi:VOC family protein [Cellulomonas shaoxiangyii]|uniref:VOC family protein n=1 Tax=Cellulomonas shaoxiangyii TaxID=2566013 RepID=A0A4P7SGZ9_9CELL|nr:VOC family protein [Cellulomonas shaoxiangyii]QCB92366.1 VOC family protein [Cellulomonas shaoxiangyii]TGY86240.1 VOC family protein [Cellulomonas shaoxiangyii]